MAQAKSRAKGSSSKGAGNTRKRSAGATGSKSRNGSKAASTKATSSARSRSASTPKRKRPQAASRKTGSSTRSRPTSRQRTTPRSRSTANGAGSIETARSAIAGRTKDAGETVRGAGGAVTTAAAKARVPLLAGGAALAGTLGGVALGNAAGKRGGRKMLGIGPLARPKVKIRSPKPKVKIRSQDVASVAKDIGAFGEQMESSRPRCGKPARPRPVAVADRQSKSCSRD